MLAIAESFWERRHYLDALAQRNRACWKKVEVGEAGLVKVLGTAWPAGINKEAMATKHVNTSRDLAERKSAVPHSRGA